MDTQLVLVYYRHMTNNVVILYCCDDQFHNKTLCYVNYRKSKNRFETNEEKNQIETTILLIELFLIKLPSRSRK